MKDAESKYSLGKRFEPTEEVKGRLEERERARKERQMEKKRKREVEEGNGEETAARMDMSNEEKRRKVG